MCPTLTLANTQGSEAIRGNHRETRAKPKPLNRYGKSTGAAVNAIEQKKRHRVPLRFTQHGLAGVYLVGVELHQLMQLRIDLHEDNIIGEQSIVEGRIATHVQAKTRLAKWLK